MTRRRGMPLLGLVALTSVLLVPVIAAGQSPSLSPSPPSPSPTHASVAPASTGTVVPASVALEPFWTPFEPSAIPFAYTCSLEITFTASDLAAARTMNDVSPDVAAAVARFGEVVSDGLDWFVVVRTADRLLALAPTGSAVDEQVLEASPAGWRFKTGGGPCTPSVAGTGRWRLDPAYPAPGPRIRSLHVLGYNGCNGAEKAGRARIRTTTDAVLIAIPMRSAVRRGSGPCLGPRRMSVRLPEPLGERALFDAGELPLRRIAPNTGLGERDTNTGTAG